MVATARITIRFFVTFPDCKESNATKPSREGMRFKLPLSQGCQTYGPRAKTGPLRGWIRPTGWFCN